METTGKKISTGFSPEEAKMLAKLCDLSVFEDETRQEIFDYKHSPGTPFYGVSLFFGEEYRLDVYDSGHIICIQSSNKVSKASQPIGFTNSVKLINVVAITDFLRTCGFEFIAKSNMITHDERSQYLSIIPERYAIGIDCFGHAIHRGDMVIVMVQTTIFAKNRKYCAIGKIGTVTDNDCGFNLIVEFPNSEDATGSSEAKFYDYELMNLEPARACVQRVTK